MSAYALGISGPEKEPKELQEKSSSIVTLKYYTTANNFIQTGCKWVFLVRPTFFPLKIALKKTFLRENKSIHFFTMKKSARTKFCKKNQFIKQGTLNF